MKESDLRAALIDVRSALSKLDEGDEEARKHLESVVESLEGKASAPTDEGRHATALERLAESIDRLRLEHPQATELLNRIATSLSEAGI